MNNAQTAEIIKNLCKKNKITVKVLLETLNINKNFLQDLEKKGVNPSIDKIEKIADYFNTSIDFIIGRGENKENETKQDTKEIQKSNG